MSDLALAMPAAVQTRLWVEAGDFPAFAILDGARNEALIDALHADNAPPWRCLFPGDLAADMARVAPYLVELEQSSGFTRRLLAQGWGQNWGIFLTSSTPLPALWRHLRAQTRVYGPNLDPLYFRFYDPRVIRSYLPTCDANQLARFFGPVNFFMAEDDAPARARAWSLADGALVTQTIGN
jgi:hypothetical protein